MAKKNIFKKWKKHSDDGSEKVKMKKSTIIIIEVVCAALIFGILVGIKYLVTNKANDDIVYLENQVVNNLTFTDFTLNYENEESKVNVKMINYTEENIQISKLIIRLYAKDNTKVSEITADFTTDGNPYVIGPNQETLVENSVKLDLTNVSKVEYIVE